MTRVAYQTQWKEKTTNIITVLLPFTHPKTETKRIYRVGEWAKKLAFPSAKRCVWDGGDPPTFGESTQKYVFRVKIPLKIKLPHPPARGAGGGYVGESWLDQNQVESTASLKSTHLSQVHRGPVASCLHRKTPLRYADDCHNSSA